MLEQAYTSESDDDHVAAQMTQPLTAILMNAEAALRWLSGHHADPDEARRAIERIIADGRHAAHAVRKVRYAAPEFAPGKAETKKAG